MPRISYFRDISGLAMLLKIFLGAYMAAALVNLWSNWRQIDLLTRLRDGWPVTQAEVASNEARQQFVGILGLVVFAVTGFLFLRWTYLANRNARFLGASGMRFTPGWSVGWYFIPFAALWMPYRSLKETFQASHPGFAQDWRRAPTPGLLPVWWTLWVLLGFLSPLIFRTAFRADSLNTLLASSWISLGSDALELALGVVAILVVAELQGWQTIKCRHAAADAF